LFGIGDELPPHYHLATVKEVDDHPEALMKVMVRQDSDSDRAKWLY